MKNNNNYIYEERSRSFASAMFLFLTFLIVLALVVRTGEGSETFSYFRTKGDISTEIKVKGVQLKVYQDLGDGYQDVTETGFDLDTQYFVPDKTYSYDLIIKNDERATVKAQDYHLRWWFTANIDGVEYDITDYCTVDSAFVYKQNDNDGKTRFYSVNGLYSNVISAQNQLTFLSKLKFKSEYNNTTGKYTSILDQEASGSKVKVTAHIEGNLDSYEILKPRATFYTEKGEVLYEEGTDGSTTIKVPTTLPSSSITEDGTTLYFQGWIKNGSTSIIYTPNEEVEVEEGDVFTPYYAQDPDYSDFTFKVDSVTGEYILAGANKNITSAEIPALAQGQIVSVVNDRGFYSYSSLQTVTLPQTITKIGDAAFQQCTSLTSINIPDSVTSIGSYAFYLCTSLESIDIPNSVTTIGNNAFAYCALTSVSIPASVTSIGGQVFNTSLNLSTITVDENNQYYCSENNILYDINKTVLMRAGINVINPTLPTTLKSIDNRAFNGSQSTILTIPEGVETIGFGLGANSQIVTLNLPASLKTIATRDDYAIMKHNTTNRVINLASGNEYFTKENGVLYDINKTKIYIADSSITSYIMPDSVTTVYSYAFSGTSITEFSFNSKITEIPHDCLSYCYSLQSLTIQSHITKIGYYAFYACANLKTVVIPSSVRKIDNRAFAHTAVTSITFENTTGWYVTSSSSYNNGTSIDVTDPSTNATNLNTGIWYTKYLYRV